MQHLSTRRHQAGISLIESLVALLVLALGILGLAGLQTRNVTESRLTNARAAAVRMAGDIQERMKLNTAAHRESLANNTPNAYLVDWGAVAPDTDCNTTPCTGAQMASFDLTQWKATLAATLPGGDGSIYQLPDDPTSFGVLIAWTNNVDTRADADPDTYTSPFEITTNVADAECPDGMICHLVRIRP